jgi:hypothetical protein
MNTIFTTATLELEGLGWDNKPDVLTFQDDPVAMACAVYRSWKTDQVVQFADLEESLIMPEDRICADAIRQYYGVKFVEMALRHGRSLSQFRLKLAEVLRGQRQLKKSEVGMLYRLPYFYDEDVTTDWIYENTAVDHTVEHFHDRDQVLNRMTLTPLRRVLRSQRSGDVVKYWFVDQHQHPVMIPVAKNNLLNSLMESLWSMQRLEVTGQIKIKSRIGHGVQNRFHFELFNMKLINCAA